ncbi:MAG: sulfurtransferase [Gammaproteobacteria bacterium]|nr:sulfurtransferase [Gammaproteobacteria bacterium]MYH89655.1 sulfurtransferase [Gammaproteobacteria bacterium]
MNLPLTRTFAGRTVIQSPPFPEFVIRAEDLHAGADDPSVRVIDLRPAAHGGEGYIPGSVHLDYARLVRGRGTLEGLMPEPGEIAEVLSSLGIEPWHRVVAYDDETGVEAARLLWTLAVAGHGHYALLDGGFAAWEAAGLPVAASAMAPRRSRYPVGQYNGAMVDKAYVLEALARPEVAIVDTRNEAEFAGQDVRARRGGRIPGAVHFDWMSAIDLFGSGELLPRETLMTKLADIGVFPEGEVILYCQANRRCAHTFVVLKWLGFDRVRSYAGSWSEWGNADDTPIEH